MIAAVSRRAGAAPDAVKSTSSFQSIPSFLREIIMARASAVKDPYTKSQLHTAIAEQTGLSKKDVGTVLDSLAEVIGQHIKKRGPGTFTLPGLLKVKTQRKPATKARPGVNPFTGEQTVFKAKPARTIVKIQPLKALKDMAL
jgi:nucleoid DNA-binding protein